MTRLFSLDETDDEYNLDEEQDENLFGTIQRTESQNNCVKACCNHDDVSTASSKMKNCCANVQQTDLLLKIMARKNRKANKKQQKKAAAHHKNHQVNALRTQNRKIRVDLTNAGVN